MEIVIPSAANLGLFVSAALVLLLIPGPAVLYIIGRSVEQGRLAGVVSVLGITTATLVHVAAATLFGAWEGGLIGIATENKKLERFHDDLEAGKYLILIYALREKEDAVRRMMGERHPEADFVAVDSHFINPFSGVKRAQSEPAPGRRA